MVHSFLLFSFPFQFFVIKGSLCFLLLSFAPFLVKQWKRVLFLLSFFLKSLNKFRWPRVFVVVLYLLQSGLSTEKAVLVMWKNKELNRNHNVIYSERLPSRVYDMYICNICIRTYIQSLCVHCEQ